MTAKEFNLDDYKYVVTDMPYSEFVRSFAPRRNDIAPTDRIDGYFMEHDNGAQWDRVRGEHVQLVWTVVEDEPGVFALRNGLLVENRRGYVLAERNHNPREIIRIEISNF